MNAICFLPVSLRQAFDHNAGYPDDLHEVSHWPYVDLHRMDVDAHLQC